MEEFINVIFTISPYNYRYFLRLMCDVHFSVFWQLRVIFKALSLTSLKENPSSEQNKSEKILQ